MSELDNPSILGGERPQRSSPPQPPFGSVPAGVRIQPTPQFSPELQAALKKARDESGGRWAVAIFSASDAGEVLNLHFTRGKEWSDDWFVRAYRLFVAEFLKVEPEMLEGIHRGSPAGPAGPAGPAVAAGPASDTGEVVNVPGEPAEPGKAATE